MLITDLAVFTFDKETREMTLVEVSEDSSVEEVVKNTGCKFTIAKDIKTF